MPKLRFARVLLHVLTGVCTCAFIFPWISAPKRDALVRRWSHQLLSLCKVRVKFIDQSGGQLADHALIIANHVSWLDIFVINSWQACHFVAKADIRSWPIAGWLSAQAGTIFLARGKQREVRRIYERLVHQLEQNKRIAFFPEGTTGAQGGLLPFHANLFKNNRAEFFSIDDEDALKSAFDLTKLEGIIPALESAHALAVLEKKKFGKEEVVVICLSGRGDKDMETYLSKVSINSSQIK